MLRRLNEVDTDDEDVSMTDLFNEIGNSGTMANHAPSTANDTRPNPQEEVPGWDPWFKAVRNEFITACIATSTADLMARSR